MSDIEPTMRNSASPSAKHVSFDLEKLNLLALLILFIWAFFPVFTNLVSYWAHSEDNSHGFFIIPLSLYFVWRKRKVLAKTEIAPHWSGFLLLLIGVLAYIFSIFSEIYTVQSFSLLLFIFGVVIYFFGFQVFLKILFPLSFLLFIIPIPAQIYSLLTLPLQLLVSKTSAWLGSIASIPIYREGNIIHLPYHTLQVVNACSGMRSLLSLMALSAAFGYLSLHSNRLRAILFLTSFPIAILLNIIRVLLIIVAFHYANYDLTHGATHTFIGLAIFVLALVILAVIKGVLSLWDKSARIAS
jgi:exosortase